jgi:hypothetical protein
MPLHRRFVIISTGTPPPASFIIKKELYGLYCMSSYIEAYRSFFIGMSSLPGAKEV